MYYLGSVRSKLTHWPHGVVPTMLKALDLIHVMDWILQHFLWNYSPVLATEPHWWHWFEYCHDAVTWANVDLDLSPYGVIGPWWIKCNDTERLQTNNVHAQWELFEKALVSWRISVWMGFILTLLTSLALWHICYFIYHSFSDILCARFNYCRRFLRPMWVS